MKFSARLYGIVGPVGDGDVNSWLERVGLALEAGLPILQYRNKAPENSNAYQEAKALLALCRRYTCPLIINDDILLCEAVGADGVHLGQSDAPVQLARRHLGDDRLIGSTCHDSLALAHFAEASGADYVAFGRCFPSTTKPDASELTNLEIFSVARRQLALESVAIGGISPDNAPRVFSAGAACIAVSSAIFDASDPGIATERLLHVIDQGASSHERNLSPTL